MKRIAILFGLFCTGALLTSTAFAQDSAQLQCEAQAAAKKLNGAAKTSFIGKCVKDAAANGKTAQCEKAAADKKLAGAAKTSFVTKCEKDGGKAAAADAACEQQADEKKLAGAARTSFTKKCVADAGG